MSAPRLAGLVAVAAFAFGPPVAAHDDHGDPLLLGADAFGYRAIRTDHAFEDISAFGQQLPLGDRCGGYRTRSYTPRDPRCTSACMGVSPIGATGRALRPAEIRRAARHGAVARP